MNNVYYQFAVLPFGLSAAAWVFTKCMAAFLRRRDSGLPLSQQLVDQRLEQGPDGDIYSTVNFLGLRSVNKYTEVYSLPSSKDRIHHGDSQFGPSQSLPPGSLVPSNMGTHRKLQKPPITMAGMDHDGIGS